MSFSLNKQLLVAIFFFNKFLFLTIIDHLIYKILTIHGTTIIGLTILVYSASVTFPTL